MSLPEDVLKFIASKEGSAALEAPKDDVAGQMAAEMMARVNQESSRDMVLFIKELGYDFAGANVIELGPGAGFATRAILDKKPSSMLVVEVSTLFRRMLKEDRYLSMAVDSGTLSIVGEDAVRLGAQSSSVDIVCAMNVVYFLRPLHVYLEEIARVLRPGGVLVFGTKQAGAKLGRDEHFKNTDNNDILLSMKDAGFHDCEIGETRLPDGGSQGGQTWVPVWGRKAAQV